MPGCVLIPNSRVEKYGLKSLVVDSETGEPVRIGEVSDYYHPDRRASIFFGHFRLKPFVQWHAGYLIGPIGYPILPFTGDAIVQELSIRIVADGYEEAAFTIRPYGWFGNHQSLEPPFQAIEAEHEKGVFVTPPFAIKKRGSITTRTATD